MAFKAPRRDVDRVFIHCSASDSPNHDDLSVIRKWHVEDNKWSDVGYHYFIKKNGTVQTGRPLSKVPAAQAGNNTGTIAICLHGLAEERFTKAQYQSLISLCSEINDAYSGMVSFHGHREVSTKSCPVVPYREILGLDQHGQFSLAPTVSPTVPPSREDHARTDDTQNPVLRLTARGSEVVRLQALLSEAGHQLEEDGMFGQFTLSAVKKFQKANGLKPDGIVGPKTWAVLEANGNG